MSYRKTEASYTHVCDICGAEKTSETTARPKGWNPIRLGPNNYPTFSAMACTTCITGVTALFKAWRDTIVAALTPPTAAENHQTAIPEGDEE